MSQPQLSSPSSQLDETKIVQVDHLHRDSGINTLSTFIQSEYKNAKAKAAVISSLPEEILAIIFETGHVASSVEKTNRPFEIRVSHVSQRWRNIALQTPRIWTNICRVSYQQCLDSITAYLERSKAVTLDLYISTGSQDGNLHEDIMIIPFCQLINPHTCRFRRVSVTCGSQGELAEILQCISTSAAPHLESVDISLSPLSSVDEIDKYHQIFAGGAVCLNSIYLCRLALHCCMPPLGSVTNFHLHDVASRLRTNMAELHNALSAMTSLAHLVVEGEVIHHWPADTVIKLPSLRSLLIRATNDQETATQVLGILMTISSPSLEILSLHNLCDDDFDSSFESMSLGQPKFPSLHSLVLCDTGLSGSHMITVVRAFPTITHLTRADHDTTEITSLLSHLQEDIKYWPHLHTVALPFATKHHIWHIHRFIVWRVSMGHPIRRLLLPPCLLFDESGLHEWRICLEDYVQVGEYIDDSSQHFPTWHSTIPSLTDPL